jgi:hypothetical protein
VVELKRPSVNIGVPQLNQIENYAFAVAQDPRFDRRSTEWDFVIVANELEGFVTERAFAQDRPPYQVHASRDGNLRIWAKPWSVLIEDARHRLKFVEQQLGVTASADEGLAYLRRRHASHLPPELREDETQAAAG